MMTTAMMMMMLLKLEDIAEMHCRWLVGWVLRLHVQYRGQTPLPSNDSRHVVHTLSA